MDDLNDFSGIISCPLFPSLILLYAGQAQRMFLTCLDSDFFIFNYFLLQECQYFYDDLLVSAFRRYFWTFKGSQLESEMFLWTTCVRFQCPLWIPSSFLAVPFVVLTIMLQGRLDVFYYCLLSDCILWKEKVKALTKKLLTVQKDAWLYLANQKIKTVAAKAVQAFQLTEEYNNVLFNWYYKGFKLLRRYSVKHGLGVDLKNLDFESIKK